MDQRPSPTLHPLYKSLSLASTLQSKSNPQCPFVRSTLVACHRRDLISFLNKRFTKASHSHSLVGSFKANTKANTNAYKAITNTKHTETNTNIKDIQTLTVQGQNEKGPSENIGEGVTFCVVFCLAFNQDNWKEFSRCKSLVITKSDKGQERTL